MRDPREMRDLHPRDSHNPRRDPRDMDRDIRDREIRDLHPRDRDSRDPRDRDGRDFRDHDDRRGLLPYPPPPFAFPVGRPEYIDPYRYASAVSLGQLQLISRAAEMFDMIENLCMEEIEI